MLGLYLIRLMLLDLLPSSRRSTNDASFSVVLLPSAEAMPIGQIVLAGQRAFLKTIFGDP